MKNPTKTKTAAKLLFVLLLTFSMHIAAAAQGENSFTGSDAGKTEIYISLNPFESQGTIEIEDSCLVLLREMPMEMTFPLGRRIKSILPAGTKYFVPKGSYKIENPNDFTVEYKIVDAAECRQD